MANWAAAIAGGLAAAADSGSRMIDQRLQEDADQRASNRKLADAERLMAIQESMKNRAAERFSAIAKQKAEEEIPVEAAGVEQTGLAPESAVELKDGKGAPITSNFGNPQEALKAAQNILSNPNASAEAKEYAQLTIEGVQKQIAAQSGLNTQAAAGKTRKRTWEEAINAAREETALNDAPAFVAGENMFGAERKDKQAEARMAAQAKMQAIALESADKRAGQKIELDREQAAQREAAEERRHKEIMAERERVAKTGGSTALAQNVAMLKELGFSPEKIEKFIFNKKDISVEDIAAKMLAADDTGELTPEMAAQRAVAVKNAVGALTSGKPAGPDNDPMGIRPK